MNGIAYFWLLPTVRQLFLMLVDMDRIRDLTERLLAFRIMDLLSDSAGYDPFSDPALDRWNIALSPANI